MDVKFRVHLFFLIFFLVCPNNKDKRLDYFSRKIHPQLSHLGLSCGMDPQWAQTHILSMVSHLLMNSRTHLSLPGLCILFPKWTVLANCTVKDCSYQRSI